MMKLSMNTSGRINMYVYCSYAHTNAVGGTFVVLKCRYNIYFCFIGVLEFSQNTYHFAQIDATNGIGASSTSNCHLLQVLVLLLQMYTNDICKLSETLLIFQTLIHRNLSNQRV